MLVAEFSYELYFDGVITVLSDVQVVFYAVLALIKSIEGETRCVHIHEIDHMHVISTASKLSVNRTQPSRTRHRFVMTSNDNEGKFEKEGLLT